MNAQVEGRRVADVEDPHQAHPQLGPGEYRRSGGTWEARPPDTPPSCQGDLSRHTIVEHEDGTITVSPSILIRTTWGGAKVEWHGYLERGDWRQI